MYVTTYKNNTNPNSKYYWNNNHQLPLPKYPSFSLSYRILQKIKFRAPGAYSLCPRKKNPVVKI